MIGLLEAFEDTGFGSVVGALVADAVAHLAPGNVQRASDKMLSAALGEDAEALASRTGFLLARAGAGAAAACRIILSAFPHRSKPQKVS